MIDRFWRPLAIVLVFVGALSFLFAALSANGNTTLHPDFSSVFYYFVGIGSLTLVPGWIIFIATRDR